MADNDKRISELPDADPLNGSELIPIVQNGETRKTLTDTIGSADHHHDARYSLTGHDHSVLGLSDTPSVFASPGQILKINNDSLALEWTGDYVNNAFFSIARVAQSVRLVGDEDSPGADKMYGTDGLGTKGYHPLPPLGLREIVTFELSGTFTKGDYPWLRAVRVRAVGGGGGGAGTGLAENGGGGGAGGRFAESLLAVAQLAASETVTIAAGGSGGVGAQSGTNGGTSSFGSLVVAPGGGAGRHPGATTGWAGGGGGDISGAVGDTIHDGQDGGNGARDARVGSGHGGSSLLGGGGKAGHPDGGGRHGWKGRKFGGGGGGATATTSTSLNGRDGADGIVILELYA